MRHLIKHTVWADVAFSREADDEIVAAARCANVYDAVEAKRHSWSTGMVSRGGSLSGGQRQQDSMTRVQVSGANDDTGLDSDLVGEAFGRSTISS